MRDDESTLTIDPATERSLGAPSPALSGSFEIGSKVGRYTLSKGIGVGGMGLVFAAHDPELDRDVALKVIRPERESGDGSDGRARLVREAQAMAKLSHPNVIPVFDVGTVGSSVFLAMELIVGTTLSKWLKREPRSIRQILDVFIRAGRGLAAAHDAGIVHRDFKPANVLVGDDGSVHVVDFGLARGTDGVEIPSASATGSLVNVESGTSLTMTGRVSGTPAYMAPEQHWGDPPDPRADQFAFCVTLFEAVFGRKPFRGETVESVAAAKLDGKVEVPNDRKVPGWLRHALLRGLEGDRDHRFASMNDLLAELGRDRGARRRRLLFAAGVLTLGVVAVVVIRNRGVKERSCARVAEQVASVWNDDRETAIEGAFDQSGVAYAADSWLRAHEQLETYADDWASMRLSLCRSTGNEAPGAAHDRRVACLDRRLGELDALIRVLAQATPKVVERAVAATAKLGSLDRCTDDEALARQVEPPKEATTATAVAEARSQLDIARALGVAGEYERGLEAAKQTLAGLEGVDYAPVLAEALYGLGELEGKIGRYEEAADHLSRAVWTAEPARHNEIAANAAIELAYVVGYNQANPEEGLMWARQAEASLKRAGRDPDRDAGLLNSLATLFHLQGNLERALETFEKALNVQQEIDAERVDVAAFASNVGVALDSAGRPEEACAYFGRALAIQEKALGPNHPEVAMSLNNLGSSYARQGQIDRAQPYFERSLELQERLLGPDHFDVSYSLGNLGLVYLEDGDPQKARAFIERSLAIRERLMPPDHPELGETLINLCSIARELGEYDRALGCFERVLAIWESSLGSDHPRLADVLLGLGGVQLERGEREPSVEHFGRALALRQAADSDGPMLAVAEFALARALVSKKAERRRAISLAESARARYAESPSSAARVSAVDEWLRQQ